MPRLPIFKEKETPQEKTEEKPEEVKEQEEIGTVGIINQQTGFYVASNEGQIPCESLAQAKILSILLKVEKQL